MDDHLSFDIVIVGAGPAGLSAAIKIKQLSLQNQRDVSVCVLEKGSEVGAHILSGAVFETRALDELLPRWKEQGAPLKTPVEEDRFYFLTKRRAWRLPTPPQMRNQGNYIISLGNLCRWLAQQAMEAGVEVYPGFSVANCLYDASGKQVIGVETTPMGRDKQGNPTESYEAGVKIYAKHTLIAEGCRGSLAEQLMEKHDLRRHCQPQTYGIGIKEIWEIDPKKHKPGYVCHTIGWPLEQTTYGGSFVYHAENNQVYLGFVVGLDYQNPSLNPYAEMQRFKHHPLVQPLLEGGRCVAYGARALNEGGYQSIPALGFNGGTLTGCSAGFLNVPKIKGSHTAMKSGMMAAEMAFESVTEQRTFAPDELNKRIEKSWVGQELKQARNIRPAFRRGLIPGLLYAALDTYILRGRAPWTFSHKADYKQLKPAAECRPIRYSKPDGKISFDRLTSVSLSNTNHNEHQPCHLILKNRSVPISINLAAYDAPEQRYCPAGVYEIVKDAEQAARLQINAQNCVHCKTCDIKDPTRITLT